MKKNNVKDLLGKSNFTMDEFWEAVDALPDEFNNKPLKTNINKYFRKDGTAKVKKQEGQEWHDVNGFICRQVGKQIHLNKMRKHVETHKQLVREKKSKTHRVVRYGKIEQIPSRRVDNDEEC